MVRTRNGGKRKHPSFQYIDKDWNFTDNIESDPDYLVSTDTEDEIVVTDEVNQEISMISTLTDFQQERRKLIAQSNEKICDSVISEIMEWKDVYNRSAKSLDEQLKDMVLISLDNDIAESKILEIIEKKGELKEVLSDLTKEIDFFLKRTIKSKEFEQVLQRSIACSSKKSISNELTTKIVEKHKLIERISRVKKTANLLEKYMTGDQSSPEKPKISDLESNLRSLSEEVITYGKSLIPNGILYSV